MKFVRYLLNFGGVPHWVIVFERIWCSVLNVTFFECWHQMNQTKKQIVTQSDNTQTHKHTGAPGTKAAQFTEQMGVRHRAGPPLIVQAWKAINLLMPLRRAAERGLSQQSYRYTHSVLTTLFMTSQVISLLVVQIHTHYH